LVKKLATFYRTGSSFITLKESLALVCNLTKINSVHTFQPNFSEVHFNVIPPSKLSIITIMKLRRMRWAGHVKLMGKKRNMYRLLVGKPEGKRPLED
jgi:hypothetical protein